MVPWEWIERLCMDKTVKEHLRECGSRRVREGSDNPKSFNPTHQEDGAATGRSEKSGGTTAII